MSSCQEENRKIVAGISLSEASNLLRKSGYKEISNSVGIKSRSYASWWISPDNTCVTVLHSDEIGSNRVGGFLLGENGKGYVDKTQWLPQTKVQVDDLRLKK